MKATFQSRSNSLSGPRVMTARFTHAALTWLPLLTLNAFYLGGGGGGGWDAYKAAQWGSKRDAGNANSAVATWKKFSIESQITIKLRDEVCWNEKRWEAAWRTCVIGGETVYRERWYRDNMDNVKSHNRYLCWMWNRSSRMNKNARDLLMQNWVIYTMLKPELSWSHSLLSSPLLSYLPFFAVSVEKISSLEEFVGYSDDMQNITILRFGDNKKKNSRSDVWFPQETKQYARPLQTCARCLLRVFNYSPIYSAFSKKSKDLLYYTLPPKLPPETSIKCDKTCKNLIRATSLSSTHMSKKHTAILPCPIFLCKRKVTFTSFLYSNTSHRDLKAISSH